MTALITAYSRSATASTDVLYRKNMITQEFDCVAAYLKYDINFNWSKGETCRGKNNLVAPAYTLASLPAGRRSDAGSFSPTDDASGNSSASIKTSEGVSDGKGLADKDSVPEEIIPADNVSPGVMASVLHSKSKKKVKRRFFFLI